MPAESFVESPEHKLLEAESHNADDSVCDKLAHRVRFVAALAEHKHFGENEIRDQTEHKRDPLREIDIETLCLLKYKVLDQPQRGALDNGSYSSDSFFLP